MKFVKKLLMTISLPVLFYLFFLVATGGRFASSSIMLAILLSLIHI